MKRRGFLVACLTALAGCAATEGSSVSQTEVSQHVSRFVDEEAGVVIYTYTPFGEAGGLATVPIGDTDLSP